MPKKVTQDAILDVAQELAQHRGFNAFSYRDIAREVGIQAPSIHHHFPSKEALGNHLLERFRTTFNGYLHDIDQRGGPVRDRLESYVGLFEETLTSGRMCLCGMLAAELESLPESMRERVRLFFEDNERWLSGLLEQGRDNGELAFEGPAIEIAAPFIAALEGAMMSARALNNLRRLRTTGQFFITQLTRAA